MHRLVFVTSTRASASKTTGQDAARAPARQGSAPRSPACALLTLGIAITLAGCGSSWPSTVQSTFSWAHSCPEDRVTVTTRFYDPPHEEPPPDVQADPERLELWNAKRARLELPRPYFIATGCGREQVYYCEQVRAGRSLGHRCYAASDPGPSLETRGAPVIPPPGEQSPSPTR